MIKKRDDPWKEGNKKKIQKKPKNLAHPLKPVCHHHHHHEEKGEKNYFCSEEEETKYRNIKNGCYMMVVVVVVCIEPNNLYSMLLNRILKPERRKKNVDQKKMWEWNNGMKRIYHHHPEFQRYSNIFKYIPNISLYIWYLMII